LAVAVRLAWPKALMVAVLLAKVALEPLPGAVKVTAPGQAVCQDLPQPRRLFGLALAVKQRVFLMGFEERFLDDIRGVELAAKQRVYLQASE